MPPPKTALPRNGTPLTMALLGAEHLDSIRAFNRRISEGGWGEYQLPSTTRLFDESSGTPVVWEGWLVLEGETVRGGYLLKRQDFSYFGDLRPTGSYQISVSEGVIDKRFLSVSMKMATHAVSKDPLLFALGMGARDRPLPRFLKALGWELWDVPFLFRVLRPSRVLRNLRTMRTTPLRRFVSDLAAFSGLGAAGIHLLQTGTASWNGTRRADATEVPEFGDWVDRIWDLCHADYSMVACRDSRTLNTLYPPSFERINRLRVKLQSEVIGWALVRHTQMKHHKQFGDLHVGTLIDCLAPLEHARAVVRATTRFLEDRGVDLIVSNQANETWRRALKATGYLRGPSNFILAASRPLSSLLSPFAQNVAKAHINRGDGDGPIHL